jgi:hypothetical protein
MCVGWRVENDRDVNGWMRGYEASPGSSILVEVVPYECVLGGGWRMTGV